MTPKEFITYVKGVIDGEMVNKPSDALYPPLRLIKDALDKIEYEDSYVPTVKVSYNPQVPDEVPYHTICSCSKENGGSGICMCVMANKMVPNPKKYHSTVETTTTINQAFEKTNYGYR